MPNIYNFIKFIKDRTGEKPDEVEELIFKCKYAPDSFTDKELRQLHPALKFTFFNNRLTKQDLYVKGDLDFEVLESYNVASLPENLRVEGDLVITFSAIKTLPNGLRVGKSVYADNSLLAEIGEDININGDLYIDKTPLASMQLDSGWFNVHKEIERKGGKIGGKVVTSYEEESDYDYYD